MGKVICVISVMTVICFGCASVSGVRDEPLTAGYSQTYEAAFENVMKAAREATRFVSAALVVCSISGLRKVEGSSP